MNSSIPTPPSRISQVGAAALTLCFALLATNASFLIPVFETSDEREHLAVARHWIQEGTLPNLTQMPRRALDEGVQPPLAYWIFAGGMWLLDIEKTPFLSRPRPVEEITPARPHLFDHGADEVWPYEGDVLRFHLLRLINVIFGAATVFLTFHLARRIARHSEGLALGATALVAFNPQFIFLCSGITNGPLAIALSTGALILLADLAATPNPTDRQSIRLGLVIGAALLTKLSAIMLLPTALAALLIGQRNHPSATRGFRNGFFLLVGALSLSGFWWVWNIYHYGDPFAWSVGQGKFGVERYAELGAANISSGSAVLTRYLPRMVHSYAVSFGDKVDAGFWVALAYGVAVLGGLWGFARTLVRRSPNIAWGTVALLICALAVNQAAAIRFYLDFNQHQGRYLFPTIAVVATLVALGWSALPRTRLKSVLILLLGVITIHAERSVLGPAFFPPSRQHDPYFASIDHMKTIPANRHAVTVKITTPPLAGDIVHQTNAAPTIHWVTADLYHARYTVHVSVPGLSASLKTYEMLGKSQFDRFQIPEDLWAEVPADAVIQVQVVRLLSIERSQAPDATVEESPLILFRKSGPS